jgi:DNA-binding PadR family transcriptional regulator
MSAPRRSVLALAVLSMLSEEPMHAYRMQQLIKERHKDDVVNVTQRNSVYQTIQRLLRDELVQVASTGRAENRPERTTYRITDTGLATLREWLYTMVSTPAREYPEFPAALSFLPNLTTEQAIRALTTRAERLEERLRVLHDEMAFGSTFLPRVFLIESEYQQQVLTAELAYVRSLIKDVHAQRVTWQFTGEPVT